MHNISPMFPLLREISDLPALEYNLDQCNKIVPYSWYEGHLLYLFLLCHIYKKTECYTPISPLSQGTVCLSIQDFVSRIFIFFFKQTVFMRHVLILCMTKHGNFACCNCTKQINKSIDAEIDLKSGIDLKVTIQVVIASAMFLLCLGTPTTHNVQIYITANIGTIAFVVK